MYKIRNGVVFVSICDEHLLVCSKEAREYCSYVMQINDSAAFIFREILNNKSYNSGGDNTSLSTVS